MKLAAEGCSPGPRPGQHLGIERDIAYIDGCSRLRGFVAPCHGTVGDLERCQGHSPGHFWGNFLSSYLRYRRRIICTLRFFFYSIRGPILVNVPVSALIGASARGFPAVCVGVLRSSFFSAGLRHTGRRSAHGVQYTGPVASQNQAWRGQLHTGQAHRLKQGLGFLHVNL